MHIYTNITSQLGKTTGDTTTKLLRESRTAGQGKEFLHGTTGGGCRHSYITNLAPLHSSFNVPIATIFST